MNTYNIYVDENKMRRTGLTREETSKYYDVLIKLGTPKSRIIIYCPTKDYYVSNTF